MGLCRQTYDVTEVSVVDVSIHSEESLEYGLRICDGEEVLWKCYPCGTGRGKFGYHTLHTSMVGRGEFGYCSLLLLAHIFLHL